MKRGAARARAASGLFALFVALSLSACKHGPSPEERAKAIQAFQSDAPPADFWPFHAHFDDKLEIVALKYEKKPLYEPGSTLKLTLVWTTNQTIDEGYRLFTHLLGPSGEQLANLDDAGPLRHVDGSAEPPLPLSAWAPGKFYRDEITLKIPDDPPPSIAISVGVYKGARRMVVTDFKDRPDEVTVLRLNTGAKAKTPPLKELAPPKITDAITIDGKLDEPAWAKAASTGPFVDVGSGRENPRIPSQGSARVMWDDKFLYVAFEVKEAKVRGGWPKDAKDPHLWEKDTTEIMIDPDGDGDNKDYYEIQINPQNLVFDTQYDDYNYPNGNGRGPFGHEEWSANLKSAVSIDGTLDDDSDTDKGYTVEAEIPWASFTKAKQSPPKPGDVWRLNFYAMKDNGGTAWSPILGMGNFHRASRFGRVTWTAP